MNNFYDRRLLNRYFSPALTVAVCVLALLSWLTLSNQSMLLFVAEYGFVETTTLVLYGVAIIVIWLPGSVAVSLLKTRLIGTLILLTMMAREADLHKVISGTSMFKLRFWLSDYPISEKVLSALIILPIAIAVTYVIITYYKRIIRDFLAQKAEAYTVVTFFIVMIVSKIIDRSVDVLKRSLNWQAPIELIALQNAFEEYLECLLPVLVIIYIYQYIKLNGAPDRLNVTS